LGHAVDTDGTAAGSLASQYALRSRSCFIACTLCILLAARHAAPSARCNKKPIITEEGSNMNKVRSLTLLTALLLAGPVFAADPIVGTWKLNVAKSHFSEGAAATAGSRTYSEENGVYTLEQKLTGADGKETSNKVQYQNGKELKQTEDAALSTVAKKITANTWNFELKKDGKVVGRVHRVVSADGKTLTVHNTGMRLSGTSGDETLVYDKQ
jgi:hypothetical protein